MKKWTEKIWLFAAILLISNCATKRDIIGSWMYSDIDGMYSEVHISSQHYISQDEIFGTVISKVLQLNQSNIKISDFDDSPVEYNIQFNSDGKLVLSNEQEELILTPVEVDVNLDLIAKSDPIELKKYWEGFKKRKAISNSL